MCSREYGAAFCSPSDNELMLRGLSAVPHIPTASGQRSRFVSRALAGHATSPLTTPAH
jgi:hypothetical protein